MKLINLDHFVLTVSNLEKSIIFYRDILNLPLIETNNGSTNFKIGSSLIKLRTLTNDSNSIVAKNLVPGAFDFCLESALQLEQVIDELNKSMCRLKWGQLLDMALVVKCNRSTYVILIKT